MRWGGVRSQIAAMTAVVVASSVGLTAVMVSMSVQQAVREDLDRSLSNDSAIYFELLLYGSDHDSWAGVAGRVGDLAEQYDRRVALKTADGRTFVDSDPILGLMSGPLRERPEVVIDPYEPRIDSDGSYSTGLLTEDASVTEKDRAVNADRLSEATACLDRLGVRYEVTQAPVGAGIGEVSVTDQLTDTQWEAAARCQQSVYLPLPSVLERVEADNARTADCLTSAGFAVLIVPDEYGGTVELEDADPTGNIKMNQCREDTMRSGVAPAVQLFLGSADSGPLSLDRLGNGTTMIIVVTIVLIAAVSAITLSTRITRPIRTLAGASRRLGSGDLAARVEVFDRGEVGELAETFNSMAASLSRSEDARRRMVSDIAHELRNPLVTLNGNLEAIQDGIFDPTPDLFESLAEEAHHLRRLVDDLHELATADAGALPMQLLHVDISALLAAIGSAYTATADAAGVTVTVDADANLAVWGDPTRLRQVVINLVGNALEHTPTGGVVTVSGRRTGGMTRIEVSNTGDGIDLDDLPHVFERFWRADPARSPGSGHTGLGLAISNALVRAHQGTISVRSTRGEVTVFTVDLPAVDALTTEY